MNKSTRLAATAGAFVTTGVVATLLNGRVQHARRLRRGEDVEFGSVHSPAVSVRAHDGVALNVEVDEADRRTPVVVFLHGWVCTLDTWHYQRLALRGEVRLVFMDLRSHGASGRSGSDNSHLSDLASDLAAVLEEVAPRGPVILVGHSMGGMAIMRFAMDHREVFERRVRGVVLISTSSGRLMRSSPALRRLVPLLRVTSPIIQWGRAFNSYSVIKRWGLGPNAQERHVDMTNEMLLRAPMRVLTDFYPNFVDLDLTAGLDTIAGARTTVLCGSDDQMTPTSHSRRLAKAIAGSRLVLSEGSGHMVVFEDHPKVTAAIEDVLEHVREEAAA